MSVSCELDFLSLPLLIQIKEFRSGPEGATVFNCNLHSVLLDDDISIFNPDSAWAARRYNSAFMEA